MNEKCSVLRQKLDEIKALKNQFDLVLDEANRTGNYAEAKALRKEIEEKLKELKNELITPLERKLRLKEQWES